MNEYFVHQVTEHSQYDKIVDISFKIKINNEEEKIFIVKYGILGINKDLNIIKIGYCCEPSGTAKIYPIFINCGENPDKTNMHYIANTGIYEASYGEYKLTNEDNDILPDEKPTDITNDNNHLHINSFAVPIDIHFVCDYITIN